MKIIVNKRIVWIFVYVLVCILAFGAGRAFTAYKHKTIEIFIAGAKLGYLMSIKDLQEADRYVVAAYLESKDTEIYSDASKYLYTSYEEGGFDGKQIEEDIMKIRADIEKSFK